MPIDTVHPEYDAMASEWRRCRDARRGRKAVRDAGTLYLPWTKAHTGPEYHDYADRAVWYGATERTVVGLTGAITRKSTSIELPEALAPHLDDIDMAGTDVDGFIAQLVQEQLLMSRACIEVSIADAPAGEQRPFWTLWHAEDVINWRLARLRGHLRPVMVVLRDTSYVTEDDDEYAAEAATVYREYALVPGGGGLVLRVRTYRETEEQTAKAQRWELLAEVFPQRRGEPLPWIPIVPVGAATIGWPVEKPALLDLVDLNLAHWRNSADYETALACIKPVYCVFGIPEGTEIILGSRRAITSDQVGASAHILQGADPVGLRTAMKEKEHGMATLGARLLEQQSTAPETATAVRMRHAGDEASLRTVADTMAQGLEEVLGYHAWLAGFRDTQIVVSPNKDYIAAALSPDEIRAYMELLNGSRISYETFYTLLQQGEIARPGVTVEEELEAIEAEAEAGIGQLTGSFGAIMAPEGEEVTEGE